MSCKCLSCSGDGQSRQLQPEESNGVKETASVAHGSARQKTGACWALDKGVNGWFGERGECRTMLARTLFCSPLRDNFEKLWNYRAPPSYVQTTT